MRTTTALVALALALTASAHGPELSMSQLVQHQAISSKCAAKAGAFTQARKKRSLAKRQSVMRRSTNVNIHTESAHESTIKNDTCVLVPEAMAGPYVWPRADTLRQDMVEDQVGVPLFMDIGVLDIDTCEPVPNILLDFWHCNSTGSYSSFEALSPNTPFQDVLAEKNATLGSDLHTGNSTWLRGMWPTDINGVMEMQTIFPGFYVERTIHIHVRAHTNWTIGSNGTVTASNVASTGQLFFDEDTTEKVLAIEPYSRHTQINRTTNAEDFIFAGETVTGWSPVFQVEPLDGVDITNGMVGYITMGINTTYTSLAGCWFNCTATQNLNATVGLDAPGGKPTHAIPGKGSFYGHGY